MILLVYGTRPEYLKLKPLITELTKNGVNHKVLFTGQQKDLANFPYDYSIRIDDGLNRLDTIVKSLMDNLEYYIKPTRGEYIITHVLVQGDTTTALAMALSAFHHGLKVIHLEAGLRTYDKYNPYPEEINRRLISQIADIHLCPTEQNQHNLFNEISYSGNVHVVGNTVIDNLLEYKDKCEYTNKILVTLHRRENHHWIDQWFTEIDKLAEKHQEYEFILPIHPNPNVLKHKDLLKHVTVIEPLPYEELLELLVKTRLVITDSGGLQEECSFFNKKCLTCRITTERPEAIGQSTFMVSSPNVLDYVFNLSHNQYEINYDCPFGDGHAAEKIYEILKDIL
jgi:UDP-N-acetylglucosamine 2-epimerase (non-hydrolysing)